MTGHMVSERWHMWSEITYGVVTNAHSRCDVSEAPQAALGEVNPLLLEVLKFLVYGQQVRSASGRADDAHRKLLSILGSTLQSFLQGP